MGDTRLRNKIRNRIYGNYPEKGKEYAHGVAVEVCQLIQWHERELQQGAIKPVPPSKNPGTKVGLWREGKKWYQL